MRTCFGLLGALAICLSLGLLAPTARSEGAAVKELEGRLVEAHSDRTLNAVLDQLGALVGRADGFADMGAFGDWLGRVPEPTVRHSRVLLRRAWAYVTAVRGAEAAPLLEELLRRKAFVGVATAYLAEAVRQQGDGTQALALLSTAAREGYDEPFLLEAAHKAAFRMREQQPARDDEGLPAYATAFGHFLSARPDPKLSAELARWLLDDYAAFARPGAERAKVWATHAASHALVALAAGAVEAGGARLAYDASEALRPQDEETNGRTLRFDLLVWAYRLARIPDQDVHTMPQVIPRLAAAALREGRYELAHRLARERLDISDSPAARRVLEQLPPDVGD